MEKFLKDLGSNIKTAKEEGRNKMMTAVSAIKFKSPKFPKVPGLHKSKKSSGSKSSTSNQVPGLLKSKKSSGSKSSRSNQGSSKGTDEIEDLIQFDIEFPSTVDPVINSTEDDVFNLQYPPELQTETESSPEHSIAEEKNETHSPVIIHPSLPSSPKAEDITTEDSENKDLEADLRRDHSARKVTMERIFVVTNFILEIPSAVFDQLSSIHKMQYTLLSLLMSVTTMVICIAQLVYMGLEGRVSWKWRDRIPWLYYPSPSHKPFGSLSDVTGLFCSIFQCIFVTIEFTLCSRNIANPINISSWPLIFSFCVLCSKFRKDSHPKKTFTRE